MRTRQSGKSYRSDLQRLEVRTVFGFAVFLTETCWTNDKEHPAK